MIAHSQPDACSENLAVVLFVGSERGPLYGTVKTISSRRCDKTVNGLFVGRGPGRAPDRSVRERMERNH